MQIVGFPMRRLILTKLQLMSVPVFRFLSARHYRSEGKEKVVTHLIIKVYLKICLKTSSSLNILSNFLCKAL